MKLIFLTLLLLLTVNTQAQRFAPDLTLHFKAGVLIGGVANATTLAITKSPYKAFLIGYGVGILAGLTKEVFDIYKTNPTGFNKADLLNTTLGACVINFNFLILESIIFKEREINKEL
mgnify:CR=1 FL=1